MKIKKLIAARSILTAVFIIALVAGKSGSQSFDSKLKLKPVSRDDFGININKNRDANTLMQKPTKKIYFVPGGKIGMFFLQGDFSGHQLIALEVFGKYVGNGFFAEISLPFRFKTSPAFTDIGLDLNIMYPFLGPANKSEIEPFVGGGLGLHFIGRDKDDPNKTTIAARGGMGLNLIAGVVFFKNYDFNVLLEVKYFNYLREFDDQRYHGIGLNIGATFPR